MANGKSHSRRRGDDPILLLGAVMALLGVLGAIGYLMLAGSGGMDALQRMMS